MQEFSKFEAEFNYAFIDETTKREIRRKILKALCIPGYQVPYSSPEMPIARGWGTGGLHVSLAILGPDDIFKIIDQGSDASVNACNLREFIHMTTSVQTTFDTTEATVIQTRHRIPEETVTEKQIIVFQVPLPEVLREIESSEQKTRQMHSEADYAKMWITLYESYVRYGTIMHGAGYPVRVNNRYVMSPSPIPRWDVPRLNMGKSIFLFGAGREKRIYAVPPFTRVQPLEFEDVKFSIECFKDHKCALSGAENVFLDEIYEYKDGGYTFITNDSNYLDKLLLGTRPQQTPHSYGNFNL